MKRIFTLVAVLLAALTASAQQYAVGDIVSIGGVKAIVFATTPEVKVVTCDEVRSRWGTTKKVLGTTHRRDGRVNSQKFAQSGVVDSLDGYKWCAALGEGWYLPALNEVHQLAIQVATLNYELGINGFKLLASSEKDHKLWSSTEVSDGFAAVKVFGNNYTESHPKSYGASLRAARVITPEDRVEMLFPIASSPRYKVGDYFERLGIKGVVFDVSEDGKHGKIISLTHSPETYSWATGAAAKRSYSCKDANDGRQNWNKVINQRDWAVYNPGFNYVDDMGQGWYLPSKNELLKIFRNADKINTHLVDKLASYWSSTELDYCNSEGYYLAYIVGLSYDTHQPSAFKRDKRKKYRVRGVRMF